MFKPNMFSSIRRVKCGILEIPGVSSRTGVHEFQEIVDLTTWDHVHLQHQWPKNLLLATSPGAYFSLTRFLLLESLIPIIFNQPRNKSFILADPSDMRMGLVVQQQGNLPCCRSRSGSVLTHWPGKLMVSIIPHLTSSYYTCKYNHL